MYMGVLNQGCGGSASALARSIFSVQESYHLPYWDGSVATAAVDPALFSGRVHSCSPKKATLGAAGE